MYGLIVYVLLKLFFNLHHSLMAFFLSLMTKEWIEKESIAISLLGLKLMSSSSLVSVNKVAENWKQTFIKWVTNRRIFSLFAWRKSKHVMPQRPSWQKKHFYGRKEILKPQHKKKANATKQHHKLYLFISIRNNLTAFPYSYHNNNNNNSRSNSEIHFSIGVHTKKEENMREIFAWAVKKFIHFSKKKCRNQHCRCGGSFKYVYP